MSLFSTLNTGASGLGTSGTAMSVIGNNIANINTVGYKASRAEFADLLPNLGAGLAGPVSLGTGAAVNAVTSVFGQGAIDASDNALDMAISGAGMFAVSSGNETFYTRAGAFYLDADGYVVTASGERLQGYNGNGNGGVSASLSDLVVDTGPSQQQPTSEITLSATLDPEADYSDAPITGGAYTLDGNTNTLDEVSDAADFATSVTIYDSLGEPHEVTIAFERTGANTWSWTALADGGELGGTDGMAFEVASGTMDFDGQGNLSGFTQADTTGWQFDGADAQTFAFDFGFDGTSTTEGSIRMVGDTSAVSSVSQDGYPPGELTGLAVQSDGTIMGTYSNGHEMLLGQTALATFDSNAGLERVGGTLWAATEAAGEPSMGVAGTGGRGDLVGYALEASNVDLEDEFVNMIQTQRSYQANARVVSTANDTLSELVNLL